MARLAAPSSHLRRSPESAATEGSAATPEATAGVADTAQADAAADQRDVSEANPGRAVPAAAGGADNDGNRSDADLSSSAEWPPQEPSDDRDRGGNNTRSTRRSAAADDDPPGDDRETSNAAARHEDNEDKEDNKDKDDGSSRGGTRRSSGAPDGAHGAHGADGAMLEQLAHRTLAMTVGGRLVVAALRSACYRRLASGFWAWQRATASANEDEATAAARLDGASEARTLFEVRTRFPPQSPAKRYSGAPARTPTLCQMT